MFARPRCERGILTSPPVVIDDRGPMIGARVNSDSNLGCGYWFVLRGRDYGEI